MEFFNLFSVFPTQKENLFPTHAMVNTMLFINMIMSRVLSFGTKVATTIHLHKLLRQGFIQA